MRRPRAVVRHAEGWVDVTPARARWQTQGRRAVHPEVTQLLLGAAWRTCQVRNRGPDYFFGQLPGLVEPESPEVSGGSNRLSTAAAMRSSSNLVTLALALAGGVRAAEYNSFDGPGFPTCYDVTAVHNATSVDESEFGDMRLGAVARSGDLPERG